jgi:hypothetical protein
VSLPRRVERARTPEPGVDDDRGEAADLDVRHLEDSAMSRPHARTTRAHEGTPVRPAAVRRLYDAALERTAAHNRRPLPRYLSVLLPVRAGLDPA